MTQTPDGLAKLNQLNIPCVEVGRATLTKTGGDPNFTSLTMSNVIFFARPQDPLLKPLIWATGSVTGNYSAPPSSSITLSGGPLNANFTFQGWNPGGSGKWIAGVDGTGGFNGSTTFRGAAAGTGATAGSGSITGTGAGVAK